ncbi:MAG: hypothetical protein ACT4O5_12035 [Gammaproteobacteria bacterium]
MMPFIDHPYPQLMRVVVLVLAVTLTSCATLDEKPRAAASAAGCARAAAAEVPTSQQTGDKRAHCLGAARIAQRCSVFEAALASYTKELRDLFGDGNAELADVRAGHAGIGCAREHQAAADQVRCCETQGF